MPDRRRQPEKWDQIREGRRRERDLGYDTLSPEQQALYPAEIREAATALGRLLEKIPDGAPSTELAGLQRALDRLGARIARGQSPHRREPD